MGVAAIVAVELVVGAAAEPFVGLVVPDAVPVVEPVAGLVADAADEATLVAVLVVPFAALAVVAAAVVVFVEVAAAAPYRPGSRPSGLDTVSRFTAAAVGSFE